MVKRLWKGTSGQALVEFALILPVFLLILLGITEFGRIYAAQLTVSHAAREGARLAVVGAPDATITQRVQESSPQLDASKLTISITPTQPRTRGEQVTVQVSYPVEIYAPLIRDMLGNPFIVQGQSTMRME